MRKLRDGGGNMDVMANERPEQVKEDGFLLCQKWQHLDNSALVVYTLPFFDLPSLLQMEIVSQTWRRCCRRAIDAKLEGNGTGKPKPFETKQELQCVVDQYCSEDPKEMEAMAATYGYPINKWDVSPITDMSELFMTRKLSMNTLVLGMFPV